MADIRCFNVFVDFVIFLGAVALVVIPYYYGLDYLPSQDRGFRCNDVDIRYPLRDETIPELYLIIAAAGLIIILMFGEILFYCIRLRKDYPERQQCRPCRCTVNPLIANMYKIAGLYLFGVSITFVFTILIKRLVGALRPNFWELCKPDESKFNCSQPGLIFGVPCTANEDMADKARESFPSFHAAIAFYALTFLAMYIQGRLLWRGARLVKPLLQIVCLLGATAIALLRVYDFYNFLSDVIGGAVLGVAIAVGMAYFLSDLFRFRYFSTGHDRRQDSGIEMSNYVVRNTTTSSANRDHRDHGGPSWHEYTM
ncbi:phospholipid phosphatase 3-like [Glandiceps talaboti]